MERGIDCKGNEYEWVSIGHAHNIIGEFFGDLKVLFRVKNKRSIYWLTECVCKNTLKVRGDHLKNGAILNCGCKKGLKIRESKIQDLTQKTFNYLTVIELDKSRSPKAFWKCQCKLCGIIVSVETSNLKSGNTKSCGCLSINDLSGKQFGEWQVKNTYEKINGKIYWLCECLCKIEKMIRADLLISGRTQSCGHLKNSKAVRQIEKILKDNEITYEKEFCFYDLKSPKGKSLRFDFALFNKEHAVFRIIEYDGEFHYKCYPYSKGQSELYYLQECDNIKNNYCLMKKIPLVRIPYTEKRITINSILSNDYLLLNY